MKNEKEYKEEERTVIGVFYSVLPAFHLSLFSSLSSVVEFLRVASCSFVPLRVKRLPYLRNLRIPGVELGVA
jgi:hypothetical protein